MLTNNGIGVTIFTKWTPIKARRGLISCLSYCPKFLRGRLLLQFLSSCLWFLIVVNILSLEEVWHLTIKLLKKGWDLDQRDYSPSAKLAWCCLPTQSRWPKAHWGSMWSQRSWQCGLREWTAHKRDWHVSSAGKKRNEVQAAYQKLWRSVLSILCWLLLSDLAQIPYMQSPVSSAAGEDGLVMRRPLHLQSHGCHQLILWWDLTRKYTMMVSTWKISSRWDSKEWSLSFRFLKSHKATVCNRIKVQRSSTEEFR